MVYRPDGSDDISNNLRQKIMMHSEIHSGRAAVNCTLWFFSKPLADAKATREA